MHRLFATHIPRVLGALFVYAGIYKLLFPGEATTALESLGVRTWLVTSIVVSVLVAELYVGTLLLMNADLKFSLLFSTAIMFVFSGYLFYLSTLAHPPSCGCLGLSGIFKSSKQEAIWGLARNCIILWALKVAYESRFGNNLRAGEATG